MPPRRGYGKKQATPRRLKGLAKAMDQAGVAWDEKEAARIRQETRPESSRTERWKDRQSDGEDPAAITTDWMPLSALIGTAGAGGFGYFVGESALAPYPHPSHWIAAVMAGFVGYASGFIWHRIRGF